MNKLLTVAILTALSGCATMRETTIRGSVTRETGGGFERWANGVSYGGGTLGRLELDVPLYRHSGFTLGAVASNESLFDTAHDRGEERAGLALSYRPFGGAR